MIHRSPPKPLVLDTPPPRTGNDSSRQVSALHETNPPTINFQEIPPPRSQGASAQSASHPSPVTRTYISPMNKYLPNELQDYAKFPGAFTQPNFPGDAFKEQMRAFYSQSLRYRELLIQNAHERNDRPVRGTDTSGETLADNLRYSREAAEDAMFLLLASGVSLDGQDWSLLKKLLDPMPHRLCEYSKVLIQQWQDTATSTQDPLKRIHAMGLLKAFDLGTYRTLSQQF